MSRDIADAFESQPSSLLESASARGRDPPLRVYCIVERRIAPDREASQKQTVTQRRRRAEAHPLNAVAAPAEQEPPPQEPARAAAASTRATTPDLEFYERPDPSHNLTPPRRYYLVIECQ